MQLVVVMAVRKAVSAATITFTAVGLVAAFALILLVALSVLRKHVLAIVQN